MSAWLLPVRSAHSLRSVINFSDSVLLIEFYRIHQTRLSSAEDNLSCNIFGRIDSEYCPLLKDNVEIGVHRHPGFSPLACFVQTGQLWKNLAPNEIQA
jgi:hypothetical protein